MSSLDSKTLQELEEQSVKQLNDDNITTYKVDGSTQQVDDDSLSPELRNFFD